MPRELAADMREVTVRHHIASPDPADRRDATTRRFGGFLLATVAVVFCVRLWRLVHTYKPGLRDTITFFGFWLAVAVFAVALVVAGLTRLRIRPKLAALALSIIPSKRALAGPVIAIALLVLYSIVTLDKDSSQGYYYALSSIVVGGVATVLVAFGGWITFQVTFGFVTCREICARQRTLRLSGASNGSAKAAQPKGSRPTQTTAVLQRLSKHNYALLSSLTIDAADAFVAELAKALNEKNIVTLVLERHVLDGNYLHEIQAEFQALLRRLQVSPHPFLRSTDSYSRALDDLLYFRRVVVIIRNMDAAGYTDGPNAAKKAVERGTDELIGADIPFIAIVHTHSLPPTLISESIAITPPNDLELTDTAVDLTPQKRLEHQRAIRRLAVALQPTGLQVNTVLDKDDSVETIVDTTTRLNNDGLVRFGCDHIGTLLRSIDSLSPLEKTVLRKLIDRLVMTGGLTVGFTELYDDLGTHSRLDVSKAIQDLVDVGMLSDDFPHAERRLGYRDPRIGEIAMGWALARRNTPYVASIHRTALCAAAEIFGRIRDASTRPFPHPALPWPTRWGAGAPRPRRDTSHVWRTVMAEDMPWMHDDWQGASGLLAVGAAISAAVSENIRGDFDDAWLQPLWNKADGTTRCNFVDRLTATATCRLATFLWTNASNATSGVAEIHALDRSICRALGSSGAITWRGRTVWSSLQQQWAEMVTRAEKTKQTLWWDKKTPENAFCPQNWAGHSLSLLGWTLPSLLVSTPTSGQSDIETLLARLKAVVAQPIRDSAGRPKCDVGMQIALAEGCRDACYLALTEGIEIPPSVTELAHELLGELGTAGAREPVSNRVRDPGGEDVPQSSADTTATPDSERHPGLSWYARLVALQSLFVAAAAETDRGTVKAGDPPNNPALDLLPTLWACQARDEHPIIARYASLLIRKLRTPHYDGSQYRIAEPHVAVGKFTWLDDNKAVAEAGGELKPEVVLLLAEAACLLNFAGASELINNIALPETNRDSPNLERGQARIDGLKYTTALPACFTRKRVATTAINGCSAGCTVGICGPGMYDVPVRRELSPTFIERCLQLTRFRANLRQCRKDALRDIRSAHGSPLRRARHAWTSITYAASKFRQNRALRVHLQQVSQPDLTTFKSAIRAAMPNHVKRGHWMLLRGDTNNSIRLRLYDTAASDEAYAQLSHELSKAHMQAKKSAVSTR